jgi:hypothetical protein
MASQRPIFRSVAYDFAELKGWFDQLEGLLVRDDVFMLDVDEVENRVFVGVRDDQAIRVVRAEAARIGIPPAALHVETQPAPVNRITVQDYWSRPLVGGYKIQFSPNPYDICTKGFNAYYDGKWIFVTNSHCTASPFAWDGGTIMQPTWETGNEIGWEINDRGKYACNGWFTSCRRSDAAYIQHNFSRGVERGMIARTTWNQGGPGGLEHIGYYDIVGRYGGSTPVGTWLDKTGRTSGSTYGQVTQSCVAINHFRCQDVSNVWSQGGDSGSPMMVWLGSAGTEGHEAAELHGILWGGPMGDFNTTYSSRLAGIEADLGSLSNLCTWNYNC